MKLCKACLGNIITTELLQCVTCKSNYHHNCANVTTAKYMAYHVTQKNTYLCEHCIKHNESEEKSSASIQDYCHVTKRKQRRNDMDRDEWALDLSHQSLPTAFTQNSQELEDLRSENERINLELESAHAEIEKLISLNSTLHRENKDHLRKINFYKSVGLCDLHTGNTSSPKKTFFSPQYRKLRTDSIKIGNSSTSQRDLTNHIIKQCDLNATLPGKTNETFLERIPDSRRCADSQPTTKGAVQQMVTVSTALNECLILKQMKCSDQTCISEPEKTTELKITNDDREEHLSQEKEIGKTEDKQMKRIHKSPDNEESVDQKSYDNNKQESKSNDRPNKTKILILADQNGKGMNKILKKLLGDKFYVESVIMPYATMDQVLKSCRVLCKDYSKKDFVIIVAGSNDSDPIKLQSMLYCNMCKMENTNVLLCNLGLGMGKHLNERKVNSTFKHLCSRLACATYVDIHDGETPSLLYSCKSLHREVLGASYRSIFAEYKKSSNAQQNLVNAETQTDIAGTNNNIKINSQVFWRSEEIHPKT